MQIGRIGGKFADDLLEYIFNSNQPLDIAILVNHESHAVLVLAKIDQLRGQRRSFWNEIAASG